MSEKKSLIGIQIRPVYYDSNHARSNIDFELFIGEQKKGELFITSSPIRKAILDFERASQVDSPPNSLSNLFRKRLGILSFYILHSALRIGYTPHIGYALLHSDAFSGFSKIGLGSLVEAQVVRYLRDRFPGYKIKPSYLTSPERAEQLKKRGIRDLTVERTIEEFTRLTQRHVVKNHRKHLPQKRKT